MLAKRPLRVVIPGTPSIPATLARSVCPPPPSPPGSSPGSGSWQTICETPCVWVPSGPPGSGGIDMGGGPVNAGGSYVCGVPVCRSVWVP